MKNETELYDEFEEAFLNGDIDEDEFKANVLNSCLSKFNQRNIIKYFHFCEKFNLKLLSNEELNELLYCDYITIDIFNSKIKQYNYLNK